MTHETGSERPSLGVAQIMTDAFGVVFANPGPMLTIGAVPAILSGLVGVLVFGSPGDELAGAVGEGAVTAAPRIPPGRLMLIGLAGLVLWGFATAAVTRAALAARSGGPVDLGRSVRTGVDRLVPVVVCSLVAGIGIYLGLLALLVPGLWLMALWSVAVPAIVVERLGLEALSRSAGLTRGYRWPIVGLVLLFGLVTVGISLAAAMVQLAAYVAGAPGLVIATLVGVASGALIYALTGSLVALLYARLRAIKEGTTLRRLAEPG